MFDLSIFDLPILTARCDWITAYVGNALTQDEMRVLVETEQAMAKDAGDVSRPWSFHGFRGAAVGSWRWGVGDSGMVVQVSGNDAHKYPLALAQLSTSWSRVDYAVDVQDKSQLVLSALGLWEEFRERREPDAGRSKAGIIADNEGGETFLRGSRASGRYGRVYNKHSESPQEYPPGTWRWEVEIKGHLAKQERQRVLTRAFGHEYVLNTVSTVWRDWGIGVPWRGLAVPAWQGKVRHARGADLKLAWLSKQVRPTVEWLLERRSEREVLSALGFTTTGA